ncbi:MAG: hypothetical protein ACREDR_43275 [Blastocatellia bacterium]
MPARADNAERESPWIFTREQASDLVTEALDSDTNEPELFVKLLLMLFDNTQDAEIQDALHQLMKAAYDGSIAHSSDFQEYLETIRQGQDPLEEARSRLPLGGGQ